MIKIDYKEPEQLETPDDIAIYNIKICDKYKKADYLELSSISWLKIDPKRNYQDLEQLFRHLNLDSYVIAHTIQNIPQGLRIGRPNEPNLTENVENTENTENTEKDELEYIAKITCMGKDASMSELLKYHASWEDNYECLEKTGCLMALKQETSKEEENIAQTKGVDEVKKLLECKLKLDLKYYSVEESIDFIIEDLTNKYGKNPEKIICGEIETNKVWALMVDGRIVSPIGWMEKIINQDNQDNQETTKVQSINYELIDFRKIKMERA
jgi:hypothetical protein